MSKLVTYFAHYTDVGNIIGLYNDEKHVSIPRPSVRITKQQADAIGEYPAAYYVNVHTTPHVVEKVELTNIKIGDGVAGVSTVDSATAIRNELAKGVIVEGVCYYADDEARSHVALCLSLFNKDSQNKASLRVSREGKTLFKEVEYKVLRKVAKAIYERHLEVKTSYLPN